MVEAKINEKGQVLETDILCTIRYLHVVDTV